MITLILPSDGEFEWGMLQRLRGEKDRALATLVRLKEEALLTVINTKQELWNLQDKLTDADFEVRETRSRLLEYTKPFGDGFGSEAGLKSSWWDDDIKTFSETLI